MFWSPVKLTEIGTSWGCGATVTQKPINIKGLFYEGIIGK